MEREGETDPVSKTLCSTSSYNTNWWTESKNPVTLSVIRHDQNPAESTTDVCSSETSLSTYKTACHSPEDHILSNWHYGNIKIFTWHHSIENCSFCFIILLPSILWCEVGRLSWYSDGLWAWLLKIRFPVRGQRFFFSSQRPYRNRAQAATYIMGTGSSFLGDKVAAVSSWPSTSIQCQGEE
jgi:hypothetical protein